jgi:hypothetical protein
MTSGANMDTTAPCNCGPEPRAKATNERPRYYARQLVTPEDLTLDQDYFRAKLRRHNLFLHGWGVVCGARVVNAGPSDNPTKWKAIVKRGYILGPFGDEIWIEKDICLDVRTRCTPSSTPAGDACGCVEPEPVPDVPPERLQFIAVRYKEDKTRLVRVPLGGCGCDTTACEYSRYADGYEICVIDECPQRSEESTPDFLGQFGGELPDCPPTAVNPWVALAGFRVDSEGGVQLEQCACRRQVLGLGRFWWTCNTDGGAPGPSEPRVPGGPRGPSGNNP